MAGFYPFGKKGPENSLVPLGSGPRRSAVDIPKPGTDAQNTLEKELGFHGERSALRQQSDAEFDRARGESRNTLDADMFVETVSQTWWMNRRSAFAAFKAIVPGGAEGRMEKHQYLLLREAFVHGENVDHPVIKKLRLTAIWHRADIDHDGLITQAELINWLRELCSGDSHVCRIAAELFTEWPRPPPLSRRSSDPSAGPESGRSDSQGSLAVADPEGVPIEEAVRFLEGGSLEERLARHDLSTEDLLASFRQPPFPRYHRVVYDGRAETAKPRAGGAGGAGGVPTPVRVGGVALKLPLPRLAATARPTPPRSKSGHSGRQSALREGVTTAGVPGDAVNESLLLEADLRAVGGWRGPYSLALQRDSREFVIAMRIIDVGMVMAEEVKGQPDEKGERWMGGGAALAGMLGATEEQQAENIMSLAAAVKRVVAAQPSLVHVQAPAKVFGDVHGQLRDLLLLFAYYGAPTHKGGDVQTTAYVFNGDWVDRGPHQLETVVLLFALKAIYPSKVFLVRGNHEFRDMNESMGEDGFQAHVAARLPAAGGRVYEAIHRTFDWLPLAALVAGQVLVVHGGVGDGSWGLRELRQLARPLDDAHRELMTLHALWSDPSDSDSVMRRGVHDSGRGENIPEFGSDVTAGFCEANGLSLIIRSHQYVRQGYKVMHGGRLITLFSARNYFSSDGQTNDGAMLLLTPDPNGHLRVHPKRLAHLNAEEEHAAPATDDWRVHLLRVFARCLGLH